MENQAHTFFRTHLIQRRQHKARQPHGTALVDEPGMVNARHGDGGRHEILEGVAQIRPALFLVVGLAHVLEKAPPQRTDHAGRQHHRVHDPGLFHGGHVGVGGVDKGVGGCCSIVAAAGRPEPIVRGWRRQVADVAAVGVVDE